MQLKRELEFWKSGNHLDSNLGSLEAIWGPIGEVLKHVGSKLGILGAFGTRIQEGWESQNSQWGAMSLGPVKNLTTRKDSSSEHFAETNCKIQQISKTSFQA